MKNVWFKVHAYESGGYMRGSEAEFVISAYAEGQDAEDGELFRVSVPYNGKRKRGESTYGWPNDKDPAQLDMLNAVLGKLKS